MKNLFKRVSSAIGTGARAFVALVGVAGITAAVASYTMTQGSGTTFGSAVVSTVHYAQQLICDFTAPSTQCATVKAGNTMAAADVAVAVADKTLLDAVNSSIPAGTALIGDVNVRQGGTALSTTNGIYSNLLQGNAVISTSNPIFARNTACAAAPCVTTTGNVGSDPSSGVATPAFAFLAMPATTTTQIIALSGSTKTYVTSMLVVAGGTTNVTFKYGTGSNCGTGTTTLSGPWPLTAQAGFSKGSGTGAVMIVPAGQALCVTTDASVGGAVDMTYQQF